MSAARVNDVLDHSLLHAKRFDGITRNYSKADVEKLRGSFKVEHSVALMGARRLWELLHTEEYVHALGALTGNMAVQQVRAGLKAIYLSGWQVAADANSAGQMYPDQSLYPVDSVPAVALARFHALNYGMFELARKYKDHGMAAYSERQQAELGAEKDGYTATKHQREVGTGYFDQVAEVIAGGKDCTLALTDSTEAHQF